MVASIFPTVQVLNISPSVGDHHGLVGVVYMTRVVHSALITGAVVIRPRDTDNKEKKVSTACPQWAQEDEIVTPAKTQRDMADIWRAIPFTTLPEDFPGVTAFRIKHHIRVSPEKLCLRNQGATAIEEPWGILLSILKETCHGTMLTLLTSASS